MTTIRPLQGAAAVRAENEWRATVGLAPFPITRHTIEYVEKKNVRKALDVFRKKKEADLG